MFEIIEKQYKSNSLNYFFILGIILFIPRILYILIFAIDSLSGDADFYLDVANNLLNGCGFSFTNVSGECEILFGGHFPGYFLLLSTLLFFGADLKRILLFKSIAIVISILCVSNSLIQLGMSRKKVFWFTILFGFSPLSFGFSRFIVIEPILYCFSMLMLSETINLLNNKKKFYLIFIRALIITIISIYFKPTSFLIISPFLIACYVSKGAKFLIKYFFLFLICLILAITPWGIRDLRNGATYPFQAWSSRMPTNIRGYAKWISTFSITEFEQARFLFPLGPEEGDRKNINLYVRFNPFISSNDEDYKIAKSILKKTNPEIKRGFSKEEEQIFYKLAKERNDKLGILNKFLIFIFRVLSILLNPLNSWGLPLEVQSNSLSENLSKIDNLNPISIFKILNLEIIIKLFFKGFLFIYRLFIYIFFMLNLNSMIRNLNESGISLKSIIFNLKKNVFFIATSTLIFSNLILYLVIFSLFECRYLYPFISWIEFVVLLSLINPDMKFKNIYKST